MVQLCWKTERDRQELHERSLRNIRAQRRMKRARALPEGIAPPEEIVPGAVEKSDSAFHVPANDEPTPEVIGDGDEIAPVGGQEVDCRSVIRQQADVESIVAAVESAFIPRWLNRRRLRLDVERVFRRYVVLEHVGPKQPRDQLRRAYAGLAYHARRIRELFDDERIGIELLQELVPSFPAYSGQPREGGGCEKAPSLAVLQAGLRRLERRTTVRSAKAAGFLRGSNKKKKNRSRRQQSALDWLLGQGLRLVFERWFQQQRPVHVSQSRTIVSGEDDINSPPTGAYIDFALAVLQDKNLKNSDGSPISRGTVYVAVRTAQAAEKRSTPRLK